jgi:triacylglycerol lipase
MDQNVPTHSLIIDGIFARPWRWEPLRRLLAERCGSAEIWRYDSTGRVPFEDLARQLADHIARFEQPVNLIGYSMGGLIVRTAHLIDPQIRVRRAVFMNSPHEGSILAWLLPLRGIRQMRPTCDFIKRIRADRWDIPSLVIWNPLDTMVIPGSSTRWTGASRTICCRVPVHLWPVWSRKLHRDVTDFVAHDAPTSEA